MLYLVSGGAPLCIVLISSAWGGGGDTTLLSAYLISGEGGTTLLSAYLISGRGKYTSQTKGGVWRGDGGGGGRLHKILGFYIKISVAMKKT